MLKVENLAASYGPAQVLFDISFTVNDGEVVTLIGRNGMGKTTTIFALMGLVPPTGGRASFDGMPLIGLPPYAIAQAGIGLVPEGRQIFPTLSVEENLIATGAARFGKAQWTLQRVYRVLPALAARKSNMGNELSGGEQQMLAIGRALMTNPKILDSRRGHRRSGAEDPQRNLELPDQAEAGRPGDPASSTSTSMR